MFKRFFSINVHNKCVSVGFEVNNQTYITKEGWLSKWAQLVSGAKNLSDFPLWLQYFAKVLFQVINRSGMYHFTHKSIRMHFSNMYF